MRVLHTISSMDLKSGGPSTCVWNLLKGLNDSGVDVNLLSFEADTDDQLVKKVNYTQLIKRPLERRYGYSGLFKERISNYANADLIHANGLWQFPTHYSAKFSRKYNIPFIISTHGMLYPEALQRSYWIKMAGLVLFQKKDLNLATVIHATCLTEKDFIKELGYRPPIAVIPNASEISPGLGNVASRNEKIRVGFVGRIAPIKNIENLLQAWAVTGSKRLDCELVLVGEGDISYSSSLKSLASALGISNIKFTGFLSGTEKENIYRELTFLVLPSKSENFGMVVPEALIRQIPVIASKGAPWEELNTHRAGWWIDLGVNPLVMALTEALSLSDNERQEMGKNGRMLVEQKYSIESIAVQMVALYNWILDNGSKPDFVYT